MKNTAFVFPGQGSQSVGMLDGFDDYPEVDAYVQRASQVLNMDLLAMIKHGSADELNKTQWTQPALLATSVGLFKAVQAKQDINISCMAGHSLGEYSALVCAGVIAFDEAIELVHKRGLYMQSAVPKGSGSMAAILGLSASEIESACDHAQQLGYGTVSPANYNSNGQVVIAGTVEAVAKASQLCVDAGAKKVMPLAVSVPSHCDLMRPAASQLAEDLQPLEMCDPHTAILHNVDAKSHVDQGDIKKALQQQLYSPVKWTQTMEALKTSGVDTVIECGPGKVLSGLFKRFDRSLEVIPLSTAKGIEKLIGA